MGKSCKANKNENEAAYQQTQHLLKEREQEPVPCDMLLTSLTVVEKKFAKRIGDQLLHLLGPEFLWQRATGDSLILCALNKLKEKLKDRRVVELCHFRVPEEWIGVGLFKLDMLKFKKRGNLYTLLISLYLFSNSDDFSKLMGDDPNGDTYLVSLYLDEQKAKLFFVLAQDSYNSLD